MNEDDPEGEETNPPIRRYSTTQEQDEVDEKIRKFQRSSMSRRSSAMRSPILEEVIARITQSFSSRSEIVSIKRLCPHPAKKPNRLVASCQFYRLVVNKLQQASQFHQVATTSLLK